MFEISLYVFLRCFCFIPRKFQSIFIKGPPNTIDSMWLFFVLFHFSYVFWPFEMLFFIVHEYEFFISLHSFFQKSYSTYYYKGGIQNFCLCVKISLAEFYNISFNWFPFLMAKFVYGTLFSLSGCIMAFV